MPRTARGAVTLAEEEPRSPRRRRVAALVTLGLVGVLGTGAYLGVCYLQQMVTGERCQADGILHDVRVGADEASNAAAITAIAVERDLPSNT